VPSAGVVWWVPIFSMGGGLKNSRFKLLLYQREKKKKSFFYYTRATHPCVKRGVRYHKLEFVCVCVCTLE
jgi:hypothetical protein